MLEVNWPDDYIKHDQLMIMIATNQKEISGGDACVPNRVGCQARDLDLDPAVDLGTNKQVLLLAAEVQVPP